MIEVVEAPEHGYTCIVLEYLEGIDLLDFVLSQPESRLNPTTAGKIFAQILSAVRYLHNKGIAVSHSISQLSHAHFQSAS